MAILPAGFPLRRASFSRKKSHLIVQAHGHPRVVVTPHVASETNPRSAAGVVADSIRRFEAGEPVPNLVDRARGY